LSAVARGAFRAPGGRWLDEHGQPERAEFIPEKLPTPISDEPSFITTMPFDQ
jgi:hypothetical protein